MLLGDSAGIKYDTGMEDPNKGTIRDSLFSKMLKEYEDDLKKKDVKAAVKEVKESDEEEKPKGLMARRK